MIKLTRINGKELFINPHQIEFIEEIPDTIIKMFSGKKVIVTESVSEIEKKIIEYRRHIGYVGNESTY